MIKIADQIWAIVNGHKDEDNLAYMCPYTLTKAGEPDSGTKKMMNTGAKWAKRGETPIYEAFEGSYYRQWNLGSGDKTYGYKTIGHKPAGDGEAAVYDNVPTKGFKVGEDVTRWKTENKFFRLTDPRGFTVEIPTGNLSTLMQSCTIINGVIQEECVWGKDGVHILLPVHSPEYAEARGEIAKVEEALKLKDLNPGDWVKLHMQGENGTKEHQFIGLVKLEWLQKSHIFDRSRSGYSYYGAYAYSNHRDHQEQTVTDGQWVGLFVDLEVCTKYGNHHKGVESEYAPGVYTGSLTVKVIARRAGELPEGYRSVEELNERLAAFAETSWSKGRSDCPERVKNKMSRKEDANKGYYSGQTTGIVAADYFAKIGRMG